jgi:hypothetical protein
MKITALHLVFLGLTLGCDGDVTSTRNALPLAPITVAGAQPPASASAHAFASARARATASTAPASAATTVTASKAPEPRTLSKVSTKLADATGDSFFVFDEAPLPPLTDEHSFLALQDGYALAKEGANTVKIQHLPAFSDKATPLFTLPGRVARGDLQADPAGQRIAGLVMHPLGIGFMNVDLHVWSKPTGLRRVLEGTVQNSLRPATLDWSPDGKHIVIEGYAKDCPTQEGARRCSRILLVDVTSGKVVYRTPAGLMTRGAHGATGRLIIVADPYGRPVEQRTAALGSLASDTGYWELAATHELLPSPGIHYDSPDGRFHLQEYMAPPRVYPSTRVEAKDGSVAYSLDWFTFEPIWLGPHLLALRDVVLDLETRALRPMAPDGFSLGTLGFDGKSALVYRRAAKGPPEYRWAKPR